MLRIYIPFILAIALLIYALLYISKSENTFIYQTINNIAGHSYLAILYMITTSRRMCRWYKITLWLLFASHIPVTIMHMGLCTVSHIMYITLCLSLLAIIAFIIYRLSVGITKILCP